MKLKELASVRTGLVLPRKQARHEGEVRKTYRQLNLKAISDDGDIDAELLDTFYSKELLKAEYITQPGDVVVRLTAPYTAVLIDEMTQGILISSHFIVIRILGNSVLPEYLYWLLNTDKVKAEVARNISSSMIGTVKPTLYMDMAIPIVSMEQQKKIAALNELSKREKMLSLRLVEQRELYYKKVMDEISKGRTGENNENNEK